MRCFYLAGEQVTPYKALWRYGVPSHGIEYRTVTVISAPMFGHVKCEARIAIPVGELVGLNADGYGVMVNNKPQMARSDGA